MEPNIDLNDFETYLAKKQIAVDRFSKDLPAHWKKLQAEFELGGEAAFDSRNKFLINNFRLQYPIAKDEERK